MFVTPLVVVTLGVIALSGWLLWPEWRRFQAVERLRRDFDQLVENFGDEVRLSPDVYDAAISHGRELRTVGGESRAAEYLAPMLKHDRAMVRMFTAVFLEQIGPGAKDAVPDLIAALQDEHAKVRLRAAYALAEYESAASEAVVPLTHALRDKDDFVSYAAAVALRRIDRRVAEAFATEHAADGSLSPKVIDTLLHYDHDLAIEGKKIAF